MPTDSLPLGDAFMAWRQQRVDVARVESAPILDHEEPLSDGWDEWKAFKLLAKPGDELWTFCSPREEWDRHRGWQGLLLVREGVLAEFLITAQN